MSGYKALDTYFKAKDFEGHYETVKSIHDYANKLGKKKEFNAKDLQFFKDGKIIKASKGLQNALSVYQTALKSTPDWPADHTSLFYGSMLRSAEKFGVDSREHRITQQNYLNKCVFYGKELDVFLAQLLGRREKMHKQMKLVILMQKHCQELHKIFFKIAHIPSIVTSAEQLHWVVLSEGAVELTGYLSSCRSVLEQLDNTITKTIKDYNDVMKCNQQWIKWIKSADVKKVDAIKKNLKNKVPR